MLPLTGGACDRAGALEVAFAQAGPAMRNIARRIARDDAADVVQAALLRVWNHPDRFDPTRGTLGAYLLVTTRGAALDHVRHTERRRHREQRGQHNLELNPVHEPVDPDMRTRLAAALNRLHDDQRALVAIAFFDNMPYRQIAINLGLPEGTVKSRIRRTLIRLRDDLQATANLDPI